MTATLPDSVTIGCREFAISYSLDSFEHGRCDLDGRRILLHEKLRNDPIEAIDTLLHEVLHALDYHARLDLGEDRVHRVAFQLAAFLIENRLLSQRLLQPEAGGPA